MGLGPRTGPTVSRAVRDAHAALKRHGSRRRAAMSRTYFRRDETVAFHGTPLPTVRRVAADVWRRHRTAWTVGDATRFCDAMLRLAELETKSVGVIVLARWHRAFPRSLLRAVRGWLGAGHAASWAAVDLVAPSLLTPLVRRYPDLAETLWSWTGARSVWVRRAAAVTFVPFARRGEHLDHAYGIAERLLRDRHDLIHKATGWLLREAGKTDAPRLERFLRHHGPRIPRTTLRYAIERFPPARRRRLLRETRPPSPDRPPMRRS